jgi:hypothetical protein
MKRGQQQFDSPPRSFGTVTDFTQGRRRGASGRLCPRKRTRQIVDLPREDSDRATNPVFKVGEAPQTTRQNNAVYASGKRSRSQEQIGKFRHRILPF